MGFTYDGPGTPAGQVRFLLQDTDPAEPLLTDAEVVWLLGQEGTPEAAAAAGAEALAARFGRAADTESKTVGSLSLSRSRSARSADFFLGLAARLRAGSGAGAAVVPVPWASPSALGAEFGVGRFDNVGDE